MILLKNNLANKILRFLLPVAIICASIFHMVASYAEDNIWELLKRDGEILDLMAIESVGGQAVIVGAKYIEKQWQATEAPDEGQAQLPMIRKPLHIISLNSDERVNWQNSYLAIPDVNEIYSVSSAKNNRLCIAYGGNYTDDEFINPIVMQLDTTAKILWANTQSIPESSLPDQNTNSFTQIANIESIQIAGTFENGCLLGYILRRQSAQEESFQLNLFMMDGNGNHQWHFIHDTDLYGRMFLVRNSDANSYAIVQTNQSRDAAIEAMMAGIPFSPTTNLVVVSKQGKLVDYFDNQGLPALSKIWIKHAVDSPGDEILLVGNSKNAWAGLINMKAKLGNVNNSLEGEFSFVGRFRSNGYLLVLGDSIVSFDRQLTVQLNKPIDQLVRKKFVSSYFEKKLTEQGPVQNIVPLGNNASLILYKLASRIQKLQLSD